MNLVRIVLYFLAICSLNQVQFGQTTEGTKWVLSDLDSLKEASSQNNPFAQAFLALAYVHGDKGLNISMENAQKLAKISADAGHWLGHFAFGYLHRFEPLGPNPEEVGLRYLEAFKDPDGQMIKLAARKDPIASYVLGEIFTSDEVRPTIIPDLQLAARHYEIASQEVISLQAYNLRFFKLHAIVNEGLGIQRDSSKGINLLEEAAKQKLPSAHHYLGRSYFKGDGVESDLEMALVHFQAAADRGYGLSQLTVADFYAYGVTGPPKIDLALRYARQALNYNEKKALEKITEYQSILSGDSNNSVVQNSPEVPSPEYQSPNEIVPEPPAPNPNLGENTSDNFAVTRLPSPYDQKTPTSDQVNLKETVANSNNTASNLSPPSGVNQTSNIESVATPSENVNPSSFAICESAKKLYWGRGVQVDYLGAQKFFLESANLGNAEACRYLGLMYLRGKGVEKNLQTSVQWFERAAIGGDSLAQKNLVSIKAMLGN